MIKEQVNANNMILEISQSTHKIAACPYKTYGTSSCQSRKTFQGKH